jgi:hypothetical protein
MPDILDHHANQTTKAFIVGDQGKGKTGSLISLVALGYKLRILDFDNGADILKNLLISYNYPYRKYMEDNNIPLQGAIHTFILQEKMVKHITEDRYVPAKAEAWKRMVRILEGSDKESKENNFGAVDTWDEKTILVFDTFSTCAECAFFQQQELNNRLGSRLDEHGRDTGGAQNLLRDMLKKIFMAEIRCNVIFNSHIVFVDLSSGVAARPQQPGYGSGIQLDSISDPRGYPMAIGRALSPIAGKYFNNVLMLDEDGTGASKRNRISTVPMKGVSIKNANPGVLKSSYPIETGLAEIFCALRGQEIPQKFLDACSKQKKTTNTSTSASTKPNTSPAPRPPSTAMTLEQVTGQ